MGTLIRTLIVTLAWVAPALASNGNEGKGISFCSSSSSDSLR